MQAICQVLAQKPPRGPHGVGPRLFAATDALEGLAHRWVERVAEPRAAAGLRRGGALGRRGLEAIQELARAHRVDAAALGDVPQDGVIRDDGDGPGRVAGPAVREALDHGVRGLATGMDDLHAPDPAAAALTVEDEDDVDPRLRREPGHVADQLLAGPGVV